MSVIVNVQPNRGTSVKFVHSTLEAPTLVIYDGTATVFFSPASVHGALLDSQSFARALRLAAAEWEQGCRRAIEEAQRIDPLGLRPLMAEGGQLGWQADPGQGSG